MYLYSLILSEIEILDERPVSKGGGIVIGGFSQGCAMGGCLLLSGILDREGVRGRVVGFVGMSGWMPFRVQIEDAVRGLDVHEKRGIACRVLHEILGTDSTGLKATVGLPMFFTQGSLDEKVRMEWSRHMTGVLSDIGAQKLKRVEMDCVGHWYGAEGMVGLVEFLEPIFAE